MPDQRFSGSLLRRYREQAGLTQTELGYLIGHSARAIVAWENGYRAPSDVKVGKVARVLNAHFQDFFVENDREPVA